MGCAWVVSVKQLEQHINNFHNWFCLFHNLGGTVLRFFYWKNGPGNGGFLVKNGRCGTVLHFFLKRQLMTIK